MGIGVGEGIEENRQLLKAPVPGADGGFQGPHGALSREAELGGEAIGPAHPLINAAAQETEMGLVPPAGNQRCHAHVGGQLAQLVAGHPTQQPIQAVQGLVPQW